MTKGERAACELALSCIRRWYGVVRKPLDKHHASAQSMADAFQALNLSPSPWLWDVANAANASGEHRRVTLARLALYLRALLRAERAEAEAEIEHAEPNERGTRWHCYLEAADIYGSFAGSNNPEAGLGPERFLPGRPLWVFGEGER